MLELELLETLLWRPRSGFFLLDRHLRRLDRSAAYFGFPCRPGEIRQQLERQQPSPKAGRQRVRLLLDSQGEMRAEWSPFPCQGRQAWTLRLDDRPVDSRNPLLRHKTTQREVYDQALARHPAWDEILLFNERGELTESTRANLALRIDGRWWTPALACGLLPGVYRAELLARGRLEEARLPIHSLERASAILLINSLRGWIRPKFGSGEAPDPLQ